VKLVSAPALYLDLQAWQWVYAIVWQRARRSDTPQLNIEQTLMQSPQGDEAAPNYPCHTAPASHEKAKAQKMYARSRCPQPQTCPGHHNVCALMSPLPTPNPCDRHRQEQNRHRQRKRDERQELVRTIQQLTQRLSTLEADRDRLAHQNQLLLKVKPSARLAMLSESQRACYSLQVDPYD